MAPAPTSSALVTSRGARGRWSLEGDGLSLGAEGDRPGHAWRVMAVEATGWW
jgi:hypothetical protein